MEVMNHVREIRSRNGLSAAVLAAKIGVTRQTIHAIESGSYAPNTTVALKLARELGVGVQDLFQLAEESHPPDATAQLAGGPTYGGAPLRLGRVDGKLVAVPWTPDVFAVPVADATALSDSSAGRVTARLWEGRTVEEGRLLIAGCDPAVSILAGSLQRLAQVELIAVPSSSRKALQLLEDGLVHLAGTHLSKCEARTPPDCRVFTFAEWEQGLVLAKGNPKGVRGFGDLEGAVRIVNREVGSGSRALLDSGLAEAGLTGAAVAGYERIASGHLSAAMSVARGEADCCVAPRIAAKVFGLEFLPLLAERYDLVIPEQRLDLPSVQALLDVLQRRSLRRDLEALGGYDIAATGSEVPSQVP
jgi:molybdate-binding protein/DNA-binding XRE family transcriptional regulator